MVRLEPGWSPKEQKSLDTIRESISVHFRGQLVPFRSAAMVKQLRENLLITRPA